MTHPNDMPNNPGDPEHTDPEFTDADRAESAADEARTSQADGTDSAQGAEDAPDAEVDPTLESDIDEALADIEAELAEKEAGDAELDAEAGEVDPDFDGDGQVSELEAQLAERTEDLQRLNAEYTNYRRRTERERQAVVDTAKASVLGKFLPILDDLDLARQHGDLNDGPLKSIADKLAGILESQNLTPFGEEGEAFDPEIHEAVQDLSTGGEQVLGTVLRRGYRVGDKLVRNAMVIIADPSGEAEQAESPDTPTEG